MWCPVLSSSCCWHWPREMSCSGIFLPTKFSILFLCIGNILYVLEKMKSLLSVQVVLASSVCYLSKATDTMLWLFWMDLVFCFITWAKVLRWRSWPWDYETNKQLEGVEVNLKMEKNARARAWEYMWEQQSMSEAKRTFVHNCSQAAIAYQTQ